MTLKLIKNKKLVRQSNTYFNLNFIYCYLLILFLPTFFSVNEDNSQAVVTRKILHRNGIKGNNLLNYYMLPEKYY